MIANVSHRLIELCGNFGEGVAIKEMQAQSITLVFGQCVEESLNGRISDQRAEGRGVIPALRARVHQIRDAVEVHPRVKVTRIEVASAVDRAVIGHLNNPGGHRSLGRIKDGAVAVDEEEYVLKQVVSFGIVPQDAHGYCPHKAGIATKQDRQRFPAPVADLGDDSLVGGRSVQNRA